MKVRLKFNNNFKIEENYSEKAVKDFKEEMRKQQKNRYFIYGIDFSKVKNMEVIE